MKTINRMILAVVVSMMMVMSVWAEGKGKELTLLHDISVNGTVVKQGNYRVTYDKESHEMALWKGKTMVVKSPAHTENLKARANDSLVKLTKKDNVNMLRSITIAGEDEIIIVNETENTAVAPQ